MVFMVFMVFPFPTFTRMAVFRLDTIVYAFSNIIGNHSLDHLKRKILSLPRTISWNCCINNFILLARSRLINSIFHIYFCGFYIRWYHIITSDIRERFWCHRWWNVHIPTMFLMQYIPYQFPSATTERVFTSNPFSPGFASIDVFLYFLTEKDFVQSHSKQDNSSKCASPFLASILCTKFTFKEPFGQLPTVSCH